MDKLEIKEILSAISDDVNYFVNEINHIKNVPFDNKEILKNVEEDINASCLFLSALREIDSLIINRNGSINLFYPLPFSEKTVRV